MRSFTLKVFGLLIVGSLAGACRTSWPRSP